MPYLLFNAAYEGNLDEVKRLIKEGVPVDEANDFLATPLFAAAGCDHYDIVHYLLRKGADPAKAQKDGATPLWIAAYNGHDKVVLRLLTNKPKCSDVDKPRDDGMTALYAACLKRHEKVLALLVDHSANVNCSFKGRMPKDLFKDRHDALSERMLAMLNPLVIEIPSVTKVESTVKAHEGGGGGGGGSSAGEARDTSAVPRKGEVEVINDYTPKVKTILGRGSFGVTYISIWKEKIIVVKKITNIKLPLEKCEIILDEAAAIKALNSIYLVNFLAFCSSAHTLYIFSEKMKCSLYKRLHDGVRFSLEFLLHIVTQILSGLEALHAIDIPHGNLHTKNVLFDKSGEIKLSDAGLPTLKQMIEIKTDFSLEVIKRIAPERLIDITQMSKPDDVYSYGVILWELLTYQDPMADKTETEAVSAIRNGRHEDYEKLPTRPTFFIDAIRRCWDQDPAKRPTASILKHELEENSHCLLTHAYG